MVVDKEEFKQYILSGKTIKELQEIYNCSRTSITELKKKFGYVGLSPNSKKLDRESGEKICNSCNSLLPLSEYYTNGYTTTGKTKYKSKCKVCETLSIKDRFYNLIQEYLDISGRTYSCSKCNYSNIFGSLDFHHTESNKEFEISSVSKNISQDRFIEEVVPELNKCIILCPNCHRLEHILMGPI